MTSGPAYADKRSELWRRSFEGAAPYEDYLERSDEKKAARWRRMEEKIPVLTEAQRARLKGYRRVLNLLMVSGVWCGDCVRQGPMLRQIADACDEEVTLRVVDRDVDEELRDEVRILGALRVPVLVFLTEDFFEVGRFGDRMLATYRRKAVTEVGAACPVPAALPAEEELVAEQSEWVDIFERMILMARLSPPLRERHGD